MGPRCWDCAGSTVFRSEGVIGGKGCTATWSLLRLGSCSSYPEENTKLKRLVADLSLDKAMLQNVLQKKFKPTPKRQIVTYLINRYSVGARYACHCVGLHFSA